MTEAAVNKRWSAAVVVRKGLEAAARRRYIWNATPANHALLNHRKAQVAYAQRVVSRHPVPKPPVLRERAWAEMQKLIDAKVSEVGGNNRGAAVETIIRANGGTPGEAWCGDTVAFCYIKAGSKSVTRSWAAVRLLLAGNTTSAPQQGDVVRYTFGHTGLFSHWDTNGYFWAGEGNTGDSGAVSDSVTGTDGVKLKLRHTSQVLDFRHMTR